jgi:hypothetical protein
MSPDEHFVRRHIMLKKEDFAVVKALNKQGAFIKILQQIWVCTQRQ